VDLGDEAGGVLPRRAMGAIQVAGASSGEGGQEKGDSEGFLTAVRG